MIEVLVVALKSGNIRAAIESCLPLHCTGPVRLLQATWIYAAAAPNCLKATCTQVA